MKFFNQMISTLLRLLPCVFDATNMNPSNTGTCRLWVYKTVDAIATVDTDNYFDLFTNELRNGDVIFVSDTNVPTLDALTVTSADNAATVVTQLM